MLYKSLHPVSTASPFAECSLSGMGHVKLHMIEEGWPTVHGTAVLRTNILQDYGFDSIGLVIERGEIPPKHYY